MSQKRIPLIAKPENRNSITTKDGRLINGFVERLETMTKEGAKQEARVFKRPGLAVQSTVAAGQTGRGVYNWRGNIYSIFGSKFYKDGVDSGTVDTTNGIYTFSSCLGATPQLFLQNGVKAYTYDSGAGLVQVTDVDYPATTVKGQVYLDGTTYVMTAAAGIYGSDLNVPGSWDALNVLIAQIEPDAGIALGKQLVYVVALKEWSYEVFYDKANATGSPLGRVEGAKGAYGCKVSSLVQRSGDQLFWVSASREGNFSVVQLEGLKAQKIGTPPVERLLAEADYTGAYSWACHINGHKFVGFTLPASDLTLVYDIDEHWWYQWTDTDDHYWPICSMTYSSSGRVLCQHATNGKLYFLGVATTTDDAALFSWQLYTPNWDADTRLTKCVGKLTLVGDQTTASTLDVRVSDDDYATWSAYRTFDLSQQVPMLEDWGSFYRRAHHFVHRAATDLRLEAVEMDVELGTN